VADTPAADAAIPPADPPAADLPPTDPQAAAGSPLPPVPDVKEGDVVDFVTPKGKLRPATVKHVAGDKMGRVSLQLSDGSPRLAVPFGTEPGQWQLHTPPRKQRFYRGRYEFVPEQPES